MAKLDELLDKIGEWGISWRDRAIAAEAAAVAEKARADAAEAHAQAVIDNDEEEDIALAEQVRAEAAEEAQKKWDELQLLDVPVGEPPVIEPAPPVDEEEDLED